MSLWADSCEVMKGVNHRRKRRETSFISLKILLFKERQLLVVNRLRVILAVLVLLEEE